MQIWRHSLICQSGYIQYHFSAPTGLGLQEQVPMATGPRIAGVFQIMWQSSVYASFTISSALRIQKSSCYAPASICEPSGLRQRTSSWHLTCGADSHCPDSSGAFSKTNHVFEIASHVQITITSLIPKRVDETFIWEVGSFPGRFPMETRSRMSVGGWILKSCNWTAEAVQIFLFLFCCVEYYKLTL